MRYDAAVALPLASAQSPDKVASTAIRMRVRAVVTAWTVFLEGKPDGWLREVAAQGEVAQGGAATGGAPVQSWEVHFEQVWEFVRDELVNARRVRSLIVEGLQGGLQQTVVGYVKLMRDWLWPELFPHMVRGPLALAQGAWRSFWARLLKRVESEFSQGGQDRTAQQLGAAAAQAGAAAGEAGACL